MAMQGWPHAQAEHVYNIAVITIISDSWHFLIPEECDELEPTTQFLNGSIVLPAVCCQPSCTCAIFITKPIFAAKSHYFAPVFTSEIIRIHYTV